MKYKSKPIVVDAFQYDGDLFGADGKPHVPDWAIEALNTGVLYYDSIFDDEPLRELFLRTVDDDDYGDICVGDYVVRTEDGTLYRTSQELFEAEFDLIEEAK